MSDHRPGVFVLGANQYVPADGVAHESCEEERSRGGGDLPGELGGFFAASLERRW